MSCLVVAQTKTVLLLGVSVVLVALMQQILTVGLVIFLIQQYELTPSRCYHHPALNDRPRQPGLNSIHHVLMTFRLNLNLLYHHRCHKLAWFYRVRLNQFWLVYCGDTSRNKRLVALLIASRLLSQPDLRLPVLRLGLYH